MSRSYRKNLIFPNCCCNSQKTWKQSYNRKFRTKSKETLYKYIHSIKEDFIYEDIYKRSYVDIWLSPSDGKSRVKVFNREEFLKSPDMILYYKNYKKYLNYIKRRLISK